MRLSFVALFLLAMTFPLLYGERVKYSNSTTGRSSSHKFKITFRHGRGRISGFNGLDDSDDGDIVIPGDTFLRHFDEELHRQILGAGFSVIRGKDPKAPKQRRPIRTERITQKLDHFDGTNPRTWTQRYFVNDRYYEPGGPIFLHISGGLAEEYWIGASGYQPDWIVKAKKFKALCFYLEHRYYGESRPTKTLSVQAMKHMNTYQALSDIANFISNMTITYGLGDAPWVLFGCSYAGSLASWARLKYPHLVSMAVASGAPLEARLDFSEYADVIGDVLEAEKPNCARNIASATETILDWMDNREKRQMLKKMFSICDDEVLDPNDAKNTSVFYAHLAENIFNVVQHNKINMDGGPQNLTTSKICDIMTDEALGNVVTRYALVQRSILNEHQNPCLSISYNGLVGELKHEQYGGDWRQWSFQACNEFGFHPTSNSPNQPFGQKFDLDYYLDQCKDIFDIPENRARAQQNIDETLRQYGNRKSAQLTKVLFTYGTQDPWFPLTAVDGFRSMKVIPIEGASHCAEFFTPNDSTDSKELKSARQQVDRILKRWLEEHEDLNQQSLNTGIRMKVSHMVLIISLFTLVALANVWPL